MAKLLNEYSYDILFLRHFLLSQAKMAKLLNEYSYD